MARMESPRDHLGGENRLRIQFRGEGLLSCHVPPLEQVGTKARWCLGFPGCRGYGRLEVAGDLAMDCWAPTVDTGVTQKLLGASRWKDMGFGVLWSVDNELEPFTVHGVTWCMPAHTQAMELEVGAVWSFVGAKPCCDEGHGVLSGSLWEHAI